MKTGDTAQIEDLLLHAGWLRRFAVALVNDPDAAEDIVQDTLVAAWQRPQTGSGRAWLARVARNLAIDGWRSGERRHRREDDAVLAASPVATPEELVADQQIHRAVAAAVAGLDEPFRHTLVRRFFDGLSSAEIARGLGIPEGTVRWRLKEGIERVRRRLDTQHGDDRRAWAQALLPLLPRPLAPRTGEVTRSSPTPRPWHPITLAGIVVFVAGTAVMAKVGWSRHHAPARAPRAIPAVAAPPTDVVAARSEPRVRLDVQTLATAAPTDARPAGMGEADARSLLRELLEALQARAYDDFVAKGSAAFKAAAPADLFQRGGTRLRERLAGGYQPTLLGHLERTGGTVWLFRLEFADQGDDALAHLRTDGWQVSGFFVEDPQSSAEEKHQHRKE